MTRSVADVGGFLCTQNHQTNKIRSFIDYAGSTITKKLETLMAGGCIVERVDENLTYDYLHASEDNLWSTLYLTGYGHACRHSSHIERHPA